MSLVQVQSCFTSTETTRTSIRDGEPRTSTSTCTQLLSSDLSLSSNSLLLYVHRDHRDYYGRGDQDGHRDFHTAPSLLLGDATRLKNGGQNFALPETARDSTLTRRISQGMIWWFNGNQRYFNTFSPPLAPRNDLVVHLPFRYAECQMSVLLRPGLFMPGDRCYSCRVPDLFLRCCSAMRSTRCYLLLLLFIAFIFIFYFFIFINNIPLFSTLEQTHCAHWHVILNEWLYPFIARIINNYGSGVLAALCWVSIHPRPVLSLFLFFLLLF